MRMKLALLALLICAGSALAAPAPVPAPAQKAARVALAGRVSSEAGGAMEGVVVRAKGVGKTIAVAVVTDHEGRYSFPANRLAPGKFNIDIRAVGYDLEKPVSVEVAKGATRRADLKLVKTKDIISQLTSSEWLLSVPGTERQKNQLFRCAACHSLTSGPNSAGPVYLSRGTAPAGG